MANCNWKSAIVMDIHPSLTVDRGLGGAFSHKNITLNCHKITAKTAKMSLYVHW